MKKRGSSTSIAYEFNAYESRGHTTVFTTPGVSLIMTKTKANADTCKLKFGDEKVMYVSFS